MAVVRLDGPSAGLMAQTVGLCDALARRAALRIETRAVRPRRWVGRLPGPLWRAVAPLWPRWPALFHRGVRDAMAPLPDGRVVILGAGRAAAPLVAALKARRPDAVAVQLLDPEGGHARFDVIAAPGHDRLTGARVVASLGSVGRVTIAVARRAGASQSARFAHLPHPRVAVLVGGRSRDFRWGPQDAPRLVAACRRLVAEGFGLMVTPSARTPPPLTEALRDALPERAAWVWDGTGPNPYPAILGLARAALVTEDSVNMISEAASTGLPVHLFALSGRTPPMAAFQTALTAHGAARPFSGRIEAWDYAPLAEADRIAAHVLARIHRVPPRDPA